MSAVEKLTAEEQRQARFDEDWLRFLAHAKDSLGSVWWTARRAVEDLDPRLLPWQVQDSEGDLAKSLGKLLAARRGWRGAIRLESTGSPKEALRWRLLTLDQVLETEDA